LANEVVPIVRIAAICSGRVACAVWLLPSETVTVTWKVPEAVAVPEMTPVDGAMLRPAGRPAAVQLSGVFPPAEVTVAE
jgi:hypothetical protein